MMLVHLVLSSLMLAAAACDGGETQLSEASTSTRTPIAAFSPSSIQIDAAAVNQTTMPSMMMPEAKRVPDAATMWSPPSQSDLTPMIMHHQMTMPPAPPMSQPQAVYSAAPVAHSPPSPPPPQQSPPQQHFMPSNYHLADDEFPGNQYGPSNEYRSEHYSSYPPFEQLQQSYPVLQQQTLPQQQQQQQQQQLDTSLIPTAKHFVLVSFIGLLLLFSIIQNSITAARRKDALVEVLSNRKKRDIIALNKMTPELKAALKDDARVRCIQRTLCYETRKLHQDLGGIFGNLFGKYLTRYVSRSLQESSPGWDRLVRDAANAGSRGDDCDILYRDCSTSPQQTLLTDPTDIEE